MPYRGLGVATLSSTCKPAESHLLACVQHAAWLLELDCRSRTYHLYEHEVVKQAACQLVGPAATVELEQPRLLHACAKDSMFT